MPTSVSPLRQAWFLLRYRLSDILGRFSLIPAQLDLEQRKANFFASESVRSHLAGLREEVGADEISVALRQAARQLQFEVENAPADLARPVVCSLALGDAYRRTVRACLKSHRDYALRHGYARVEMSAPPNMMLRAAPWYKIVLIYALLEKGYENVFYIDADALVTNGAHRLEDFFEKLRAADKSWLMSLDDFGLNTGVIFVRKTPGSLRLLDLIWSYDVNLRHFHWEQHALGELLRNCRVLQKLILVPEGPSTFNKYPPEFASPDLHRRLQEWTEGDFVCHFAGIRRGDLTELTEWYAARTRPDL